MVTKVKDAPKKARQHQIYKIKDGTRVPGCTTITGIMDKPALKFWANNIGLQGIKMSEYVDNLADIGTLAHMMILAHFKGIEADVSEYTPKQVSTAENCLLSFYEWEKTHKIEPILIEEPLVSEKYRYGGKPDVYGRMNGEAVLLDFKTGKAIYIESLYQTCGYKILLEERDLPVEKIIILNIGRSEDEEFIEKIHTSAEKIALGESIFFNCLTLYGELRDMKKLEK